MVARLSVRYANRTHSKPRAVLTRAALFVLFIVDKSQKHKIILPLTAICELFCIFARYIYNSTVELITNILAEYLKHNKRLIVPKFGVFIVKQPSGTIVFSDLMRNDDGILRSLLMAYGIKELEANGMIDRFVFEIRHAVSSGEKYTVENLGEFSAGANNTIVFKQKREPQHIGGNIKPPIETLDTEKRRLRRGERETTTLRRANAPKSQTKPRPTPKPKASEEFDATALGKPDAYLRGLKYDNSKNKKRSEEGRRSEGRSRGRGRRIIAVIVVSAILGFALWYGWQWLNKEPQPAYDTTTSARMYNSQP